MEPATGMRITVTENGPYMVEGGVPLIRLEIVVNEEGESVAYRELERIDAGESYMLCRCGESANKPFCDFSHFAVSFDGAETAGHGTHLEQATSIDGPGLRLRDARRLCAEARFCDRAGGLWNLIDRCDDAETRELAIEEAQLCPSGRYVACSAEGDDLEPALEPSIALLEDPHLGVSAALFIRGGIEVVDSDGNPYEVRNRVTLCRCGRSVNKPFCDGSHIAARFDDGAVR